MTPIKVTQSFLPPIDEYRAILQSSWDQHWITNRGPLVLKLEQDLLAYLDAHNIIATTNGTLPLQIALKVLANQGEVITTPFSYIATTSSILWENCKPVFVDIHPDYLTIDETKIEAAISPNTTAILATHVFGNPCHVEAIDRIASKHGLKVIYDAAHSFGVRYRGKSIFNYGDVSTCSFHATKLFHTGEGGALFFSDSADYDRLFYSHNFGHNGPHEFVGVGTNAKMSELQAAMGLAVLPYMDRILSERRTIVNYYDNHLIWGTLRTFTIRDNTEWNYSYYPVIFQSEAQLLVAEAALQKANIFPRRYFYPSLNTVQFTLGETMPVSEQIASAILCLPLYAGLSLEDAARIVNILNEIS